MLLAVCSRCGPPAHGEGGRVCRAVAGPRPGYAPTSAASTPLHLRQPAARVSSPALLAMRVSPLASHLTFHSSLLTPHAARRWVHASPRGTSRHVAATSRLTGSLDARAAARAGPRPWRRQPARAGQRTRQPSRCGTRAPPAPPRPRFGSAPALCRRRECVSGSRSRARSTAQPAHLTAAAGPGVSIVQAYR